MGLVRSGSGAQSLTVRGLGLFCVGSTELADLDAEIARRLQADPGNMFFWIPLMY
jgi:hypothetical protein